MVNKQLGSLISQDHKFHKKCQNLADHIESQQASSQSSIKNLQQIVYNQQQDIDAVNKKY